MEERTLLNVSLCRSASEAEARQRCTQALWRRLFRAAPGRWCGGDGVNQTAVNDAAVECADDMVLECPAQVARVEREESRFAADVAPRTPPPPPPFSIDTHVCETPAPALSPHRQDPIEVAARGSPSASASPPARRAMDDDEGEEGEEAYATVSPPVSVPITQAGTPATAAAAQAEARSEADRVNVEARSRSTSVPPFRQTDSMALAEAEYEVPSPTSLQRRTFLSRKRERTPSVFPEHRDGLVFSPRVRLTRGRACSASLSVSRPSRVLQPPSTRLGGVFIIAGPDGLVRTPLPVPRTSMPYDAHHQPTQDDEHERVHDEEDEDATDSMAADGVDCEAYELPTPVPATATYADSGHHDESEERAIDVSVFAHTEAESAVMSPPRSSPPPPPLAPRLTAFEEVAPCVLFSEPAATALFAYEEEAPRLMAVEECLAHSVAHASVEVSQPSRVSLDLTSFEWVEEVDALLREQQQRVASVSPIPAAAQAHVNGASPRRHDAALNVAVAGAELFNLPHVSFRSTSRPPLGPVPPSQAAPQASPSPRRVASASPVQTMGRVATESVRHDSSVGTPRQASPGAITGMTEAGHGGGVEEEVVVRAVSTADDTHDACSTGVHDLHASQPRRSLHSRDLVYDATISLPQQQQQLEHARSSMDLLPRHETLLSDARPPTASPTPSHSQSPAPVPQQADAPEDVPSSHAAFRFTSRAAVPLGRSGASTGANSLRSRRVKPSLLPPKPAALVGGEAGRRRFNSVSQTRSETPIVPAPPRLATSERAKHARARGRGGVDASSAAAGGRGFAASHRSAQTTRPSVQFELPKTFSGNSVRMSGRSVNTSHAAPEQGKKHKKTPRGDSGHQQKLKKRKLQ